MKIRTGILHQLATISSAGDRASDPRNVEVIDQGVTLRATLRDVQPLACSLCELNLISPTSNRMGRSKLMQVGQQLAERVRYLVEPLCVHEVDDRQGAQLRSTPPQVDPETQTRRYFEVELRPAVPGDNVDSLLMLCRYEKVAGQPRQRIPAVLTTETLAMLCQDMVDILGVATRNSA